MGNGFFGKRLTVTCEKRHIMGFDHKYLSIQIVLLAPDLVKIQHCLGNVSSSSLVSHTEQVYSGPKKCWPCICVQHELSIATSTKSYAKEVELDAAADLINLNCNKVARSEAFIKSCCMKMQHPNSPSYWNSHRFCVDRLHVRLLKQTTAHYKIASNIKTQKSAIKLWKKHKIFHTTSDVIRVRYQFTSQSIVLAT